MVWTGLCCAGLCWVAPSAPAVAAEPFRYPEGQHGKGSLKYIQNTPVLCVEGTPEQMGEQIGVLAMKPGAKLLNYPKDCLAELKLDLVWPTIAAVGRLMTPNFPANHLAEMEAAVKAAQADREAVVAGNTMFDVKKFFQCSTLYVGADRSATGEPMLGRNLDFPTLGYLQNYTLVTVYRGEGKKGFAVVGFPGAFGCLSGMNEDGLSAAVLEVYSARDESASFDVRGVPYAFCFRRLLEECSTIDEAAELLRGMKRTTILNLALADKKSGAVLEITPKTVVVRPMVEGLCAATNHFRTAELAVSRTCRRYRALTNVADGAKLGLDDLAAKLHAVNQRDLTLQTMVFEPVRLRLHLAFGSCPSSALPLKTIELAPMLQRPAAVQEKVVQEEVVQEQDESKAVKSSKPAGKP